MIQASLIWRNAPYRAWAGNFPDRPRSSGKLYHCRGSSIVRRVRRGDPRAHAGRVESGDFTLAARFLAHFTETVSQNREPAAGMSGELRQTSRFLHNLRRTCRVMGRNRHHLAEVLRRAKSRSNLKESLVENQRLNSKNRFVMDGSCARFSLPELKKEAARAVFTIGVASTVARTLQKATNPWPRLVRVKPED